MVALYGQKGTRFSAFLEVLQDVRGDKVEAEILAAFWATD